MQQPMVVTVVRFPPRDPVGLQEARDQFGANAAGYLDVPGLLWKAYLRSEDGTTVGGAYWWADRQSAAAKFNEGWRAGMIEKYGAAPEIEWFEAPVVVDPLRQAIRVDPPTTGP